MKNDEELDFDIENILKSFSQGGCGFELVDETFSKFLCDVLKEYKREDLYMAAFCVNSWRYNRFHISFYLTLNNALIHAKSFGEKRINTYSEFKELINKISKKYDIAYDDEVLCDFGEIKVPFNGKFYSVFVGTGHNFLIPFYFSLETIADRMHITSDILPCLDFVEKVVENYGQIEEFDESKVDNKNISIPNENYYIECKNKYSSIMIGDDSVLSKFLDVNQNSTVTTHFIKNENQYYLLFNPSIIVDVFNHLYKEKSFSKRESMSIANSILFHALKNNFDLSPDSNILYISPGILKKNGKDIVGDKLFDFAINMRDKVIFFINELNYSRDEIETIINEINIQLSGHNLKMIVPDKIPKCKLYDISDKQVKLVSFCGGFNIGENEIKRVNDSFRSFYIYDLISMAYQARDVNSFVDFFFEKDELLNGSYNFYCGLSSFFDAWQKQNKEISQGAFYINNVITDVYAVEWDIFYKYIEYKDWFPFDRYSEMFSNPFSWDVKNEDDGFKRLTSKSVSGFCGIYKKIRDAHIFLAFNMSFENLNNSLNQRKEIINLVEDLSRRLISQFEDLIYDNILAYCKDVQITYMPNEYAKKVDHSGFTKENRKYVYSDLFYSNGKMIIRYTINEEKLMTDILNAKNKEIECLFFVELLKCLQANSIFDYNFISNEIMKHVNEKKEIEAVSLELKYVFSNSNLGMWPSDESFVKVRKSIALVCKRIGINPGTYSTKNATKVVRKIQERVIPQFELELSKFDKYELHKMLSSINAYNYHQKRLESNRYGITDNDFVSDVAKKVSAKNIIKNREEIKHRIRTINYIIDTNLAIKHEENNEHQNLDYILALANWLIVLQDCSDECHYEMFDIKIEIEDDYRVNAVYSEYYEQLAKLRNKRIYDNIDYVPKIPDSDEKYNNSLKAFYVDSGVDLSNIIQACVYLSKEFNATFNKYVVPDVYEVNYDDLLKDYISILKDQSETNINKTTKGLNYLIIDESKIKSLSGQIERFVPVWDRENRDNRFDIKPIVKKGNNIIFSPVIIYELALIWINGSTYFYPPYEYGLNNYLDSLTKWKSACEKQMEKDLEALFSKKGYLVKRSLELHKVDKEYGHPLELGDYDLLAVDVQNKILWNVESKFLGKVGSLKEYYNHQDSFFNKNKKDEKFARRIDYLKNNIERILKLFDIYDPSEYKISNYMVTNKVFESDLKKINFQIITYHELSSLLNK
ncbi:MAG: hypothetical protein WCT17_04405 [Bacilli bacterium]